MKILIFDSNSKIVISGDPYGHYIHYINDIKKVLELEHEIVIGCSKVYQSHIDSQSFFDLEPPYVISGSLLDKIIFRFYELKKILIALNSRYDCYIAVLGSFPITCISIILSPKKDLYLTIYEDYITGKSISSLIRHFLFKIAKRKIKGIITTSEAIKKIYDAESLVIPDYFNRETVCSEAILYEVVMLGIINMHKDVEIVVDAFNGTKYKVLIAGIFESNDRYKQLISDKFIKPNIQIINKYLDSSEYNYYLSVAKYVILPYKNIELKASGIVYEAFYKLKPVIYSSAPFFKELFTDTEHPVGLQYLNSPTEVINKLDDYDLYNDMVKNILEFNKKININVTYRILEFFRNDNSH